MRYYFGDATVESLAPLLLANPRGLLLALDELAGWFGSFDRYVQKGGGDAAHWLSMFNGESFVVDRKTATPKTIFVPHAYVSVCGGIQPAILRRSLGKEHRESGLAARIIMACPPRKAKRWTEADIDPAIEKQVGYVLDRLYALEMAGDAEEVWYPVVVKMTREAKGLWTAYYDDHAREQAELTGDLAAAWSKLEEYPARFALVFHFIRWAANDPTLEDAGLVDDESMAAGIRLAAWFKHETRRIYAMLDETEEERDSRRLFEWIEGRGGVATARDVQSGCRWLREPGLAEESLVGLVASGAGVWEASPPGKRGQPTRRFRVSTPSAVNGNASLQRGNAISVDVDTVDNVKTPEASQACGEV